MTDTKGFCMFYDWLEDLNYVKPDEAWEIVRAIGNYYVTGENPIDNVRSSCKGIVSLMLHQIKRSEEKASNARKGAQVVNEKKKNNAKDKDNKQNKESPNAQRPLSERSPKAQRPLSTATETETETDTYTETDTETDTDTDTYTETDTDTETETETYTETYTLSKREISPPISPKGKEREIERVDYLSLKSEMPDIEKDNASFGNMLSEDHLTSSCDTDSSVPSDNNAPDDRFSCFWNEYPKKLGRNNAANVFHRLNPDRELFDTMMNALKIHKKSQQWQNLQYVPNPANWLLGRRWEDDILPDIKQQKNDFCLEDFFENQ